MVEKYGIFCHGCVRTTTAAERGRADKYDPEAGPPFSAMLVTCEECGDIQLLGHEDYLGAGGPFQLWPSPQAPLHSSIPRDLRVELEEARVCLQHRAYRATVVMVGRAIEGLCVNQGINKKRLVDSLKALRDEKGLDPRLYDWANELRVLRNEGAHFTGNEVSAQDASDALEFGEALLEYMFVFTHRLAEFKRRRGSAGGP